MQKILPYLGLILVAIIIIGLIIYFSQKDKPPKPEKVKEELIKAKTAVTQWPLRKGSSGSAVGAIQNYLNTDNSFYDCAKVDRTKAIYKTTEGDKALWPVKVDDDFGEQTRQALIRCYSTEQVTEEQYDNLISKLG